MSYKAPVNKLPTSFTDGFIQHLTNCIDKSHKAATDASLAYALTADEKHRAAALVEHGKYEAFVSIYNSFK